MIYNNKLGRMQNQYWHTCLRWIFWQQLLVSRAKFNNVCGFTLEFPVPAQQNIPLPRFFSEARTKDYSRVIKNYIHRTCRASQNSTATCWRAKRAGCWERTRESYCRPQLKMKVQKITTEETKDIRLSKYNAAEHLGQVIHRINVRIYPPK